MHNWVCAANETPNFSHEFPFRSISFSQITKKIRSGASPFYIFGRFCRSGDHHFQNFFNFQPGLAAVPEIRIFKRSTAPRVSGRSGAPHFPRSKRLKLVPETPIFTLDRELVPEPLPFFTLPRHIPTKIWGEYPPPPPPPLDGTLNYLSHCSSGPQYELICIQPIRDRAYSFAYSQSTAGDSTLGIN